MKLLNKIRVVYLIYVDSASEKLHAFTIINTGQNFGPMRDEIENSALMGRLVVNSEYWVCVLFNY